jgi:TonB family protein
MSYTRFAAVPLVLVVTLLGAQTPAVPSEPIRIGPGVTPPRLLRKVEPEYSPTARADRIQGTVILQIVVNEKGRAADISVISPLGFGLDEQAQSAVEKWEFAPGTKGGIPVKILATVEVNFRFPGLLFDEKAEHQRTSFNVAFQTANRTNASPGAVDHAVESIFDLCRQKFAPAMYVAGLWKTNGEHVARDTVEGLDWIRKAADKNYGPALYQVAARHIDGRDLPLDVDKGLQEMRAAATLGSRQAQLYLGNRYETGDGVPRELDRARRYYRLCAAQGVALCQFRLGRLLYDAPDRRERDYLQAVALFQLAAQQGLTEAKELASSETPRLTLEQTKWVSTLRDQIVRK